MADEQDFSLTPIHFFAISGECKRLSKAETAPPLASHQLPSTADLCDEQEFADVAIGWHENGLGFNIHVDSPFTKSVFPDIAKGDSVELMIDARDMKSAGFNTRFCHHFFFLPKETEGRIAGEITRFRTEDRHPLCDSNLLKCETKMGSDSYSMKIFIPADCLYGYDPKQFDRIGFTYRINRAGDSPQHFSVSSNEFNIGQQPSLWASLHLK